MNSIYEVIENFATFITADVIYKIVLPVLLIVILFDIVRYMFSRESKKEDLIDAVRGKVIGLVLLIILPFALLWSVDFIGKMTGSNIDMDTSVIDKIIDRLGGDTKPPQ